MVKKVRRKQKSKKKNYGAKDNTNTILIVGLIALVIYLFNIGALGNIPQFADSQSTQSFNAPTSEETSELCSINLNKDVYCVGDDVIATLEGEPLTLYHIGINANDIGWVLWDSLMTDDLGKIIRRGPIGTAGNYDIRATSDSCITNLVSVRVDNCDDVCWWAEIDKYVGDIPAATPLEWRSDLVQGEFKFTWDYLATMDTSVLKEGFIVNSDTSMNGGYTFDSAANENWGIYTYNPYRSPVEAQIRLYQWVCEGDPMNWDPHMFDYPYSGGQQPD